LSNAPEEKKERSRILVLNQFDLKVVDGKIPIPDLRIEYEDDCRGVQRLDLEIATRNCRPQGLALSIPTSPLTAPRSNCTVQIVEIESLWPPLQEQAKAARLWYLLCVPAPTSEAYCVE